jgi:prevent-host-death family protein
MAVHKARHEVGVRDLRRELSRWLDLVAEGDEITVTERGTPVARIVGVDSEDALARLAEAGLVQRPTRPRRPARGIPRARARGSVADLVADQRR